MTSKAEKFYSLIDRGWDRRRALRKAGFHPGNAHAAATQAYQLLKDRYGKTPRGFSKLTERLQAIWRGLSETDKEMLDNLPTDEPWNTLEKNLEEYTPEAGEKRKRGRPPAPLPAAPLPELTTLEELGAIKYAAYIQAKTDVAREREENNRKFETEPGNCGLPWDFITGLQQTAYLDAPVEAGIWDAEHGFRTRDDLLREVQASRVADEEAERAAVDPWFARQKELGTL